VKTPVFDRMAAEGALFSRAFCVSPSCTPSRGAILTGQAIHRLEEGGNLWSILPEKFACFPDLLERAGYVVGLQGKGWGPGTLEGSGRTRNPAGPSFKSFEAFLKTVPPDKPFCFWFGSQDPHRPYEKGSGLKSGMKVESVVVPPFLPDTPEVRSDILDYYFEVERFDRQVGELLEMLERSGRAANTMVIVTSDNGMPFPRAKANLYDAGTHMPLAIRWPGHFQGGRVVDDFVSHADLAPTIVETAGLAPMADATGRSLMGKLLGTDATTRAHVFLERERHANVRQGDLSYPARALRTARFLYIRNLRPDRWPAGDPQMYVSVGPFGDVDGSPTKDFMLEHREAPAFAGFFRRAFGKRPAEELFDLERDPAQLTNVAGQAQYARDQASLKAALDRWMAETGDPRAKGDDDRWDHYPYVGPEAKARGGAR
jgi:arylsulfatase A-like enzyme